MTTTTLVLPTSVRTETWDDDTGALMEFAGLTWLEGPAGNKTRVFAPSGIIAAFIQACSRTGLDPTAKQIYAAMMGGKWTVLIGVDGMRVVAQRTGQYDGQDPIEWLDTDGNWSTTPPAAGKLVAARIAIYRKGIGRPLVQTVSLAEFGGKGGNWSTRPAHMLGIRAETHGFRRLFPMELSGLYTPEDFDSAEVDTADAIVVEPTADWAESIRATDDKADLAAVADRIRAANEMTPDLRTLILTHASILTKDSRETAPPETRDTPPAEDPNVVDADVVTEHPTVRQEMTQEQYERLSAEAHAREHARD